MLVIKNGGKEGNIVKRIILKCIQVRLMDSKLMFLTPYHCNLV